MRIESTVRTVLEVGFHRMQPNDVITILQGKKRSLAGPTAPAQTLQSTASGGISWQISWRLIQTTAQYLST